MKLLIVDDDLPFRERLTRSMQKKGFEVISSPGVKDSLNKDINPSDLIWASVGNQSNLKLNKNNEVKTKDWILITTITICSVLTFY